MLYSFLLLLLASSPSVALNVDPLKFGAQRPSMHALPPAALRDVAAEAITAASALRRDALPLSGQAAPRPLVMMAVRKNAFQQLIGELVHHVTSGNRKGTSWVRPLALRQASNVSLANAAERFDPVLGWLDADVGGGSVHLFSPLAPAAFVPTLRCTEVPPALAVAIRSLSDAHAATDLCPDHAPTEDMLTLQAFMTLVGQDADEPDEDTGGNALYDPLGGM